MSCRLVGVWLSIVVLSLGAAGRAGAVQLVPGVDSDQDLWHTVQARKTLADDPELSGLNLGVRVRNRVATLWGPVPTPDLAFRAEIRLRNLIELVEVRNELYVSGEPFAAVPEPAPAPAPVPLFLPDQLPPALPPAAPGAPVIENGVRKVQKPVPLVVPAVQPLEKPGELELPPVRLPEIREGTETTTRRQDVDRLLAQSIEALVRSKPAYRPLRYTIRDATVYLDNAGPAAAVQELARAVARVPGVEGVVVQSPAPPR
jgi:hypothetical protein